MITFKYVGGDRMDLEKTRKFDQSVVLLRLGLRRLADLELSEDLVVAIVREMYEHE
jgi:hypothetical protein